MIQYITKDVTTVTRGIICSQVNCQGVMGSGVALAIRNRWPEVFDEYYGMFEQYKKYPWQQLGQAQIVECFPENVYVTNLFGQYDFGISGQRYTEYGSLLSAFEDLNTWLYQNDLRTEDIYIPYKLGCDRGGGDWNIVSQMIKDIFNTDERTIYICSLN